MKHTGKLLAAGLLPLLVGYLLNVLLLYLSLPIPRLLGLALLGLWGVLAYRLADPGRRCFPQALALCAFGLGMLALVLWQELALGEYWQSPLGFASQMYFLPALSAASAVMAPFLKVVTPWPLYIGEWALLLAAACGGCCRLRLQVPALPERAAPVPGPFSSTPGIPIHPITGEITPCPPLLQPPRMKSFPIKQCVSTFLTSSPLG